MGHARVEKKGRMQWNGIACKCILVFGTIEWDCIQILVLVLQIYYGVVIAKKYSVENPIPSV